MDDSRELALLEAIAREPEALDAYVVYADWLQQHGALRGDLAALQAASSEQADDEVLGAAARDHLRAHATYYLGEVRDLLDSPHVELGWRCGFLSSVVFKPWPGTDESDLGPAAGEVFAALLRLESARFLTRIAVDSEMRVGLGFVSEVVQRAAPATLRRLWIGDRMPSTLAARCQMGDLSGLWSAVPGLLELGLTGQPSALGTLALPQLRHATLWLSAASDAERTRLMRAVAEADWPRLERLRVWDGHSPALVASLLARDDLVTLGDVGIINCAFADHACALFAEAPLAPQLTRISLARGALTDAGAHVLLANRAAFPNLETLDVSSTLLSSGMVEALRRVVPTVISDHLRVGGRGIQFGTAPGLDPQYDDD